jgi:hypothetical protein
MKEVEKTEDKLVFSEGDKNVQFDRLKHGVAMNVTNIRPGEIVLTIENFVSYIAWEHHVDLGNVEHGRGRSPRPKPSGWDNMIGNN